MCSFASSPLLSISCSGREDVSGGATIELPRGAAQQYLRGELGVYADSVGSGEDAWRTNHEVNEVVFSSKRFCA